MYSCIKNVTFSRDGFPDVICREMLDDISGKTDVQIRGGKNNHNQSGYNWQNLQGEFLTTYNNWISNCPSDVKIKIEEK